MFCAGIQMLDGQPVGHRNRNLPQSGQTTAAARRRQRLMNTDGGTPAHDAAQQLPPLFWARNGDRGKGNDADEDMEDGVSGPGGLVSIEPLSPDEQFAAAVLLQQTERQEQQAVSPQAPAPGIEYYGPTDAAGGAGTGSVRLRAEELERISSGSPVAPRSPEWGATHEAAAQDDAAASAAGWPDEQQRQQHAGSRKPRSSSMSVQLARTQQLRGATDLLARPLRPIPGEHLNPASMTTVRWQTSLPAHSVLVQRAHMQQIQEATLLLASWLA